MTLPLSELVTDHDDVTLAGDPGTELLDLPDDLALPDTIPADQLAMHDAAPAAFLSVAASDAAAWTEYEWASWMAQVLRDAGVPVIEYPGWATRGRPRSVGRFQPRGVMWHHDASPQGPSPYVAKFCAEIGRPAEGIPAPLSQTWVCDGCNAHAVGTWHVLAAGRANHAGTGSWGSVGTDQGNAVLIGVETDHTAGEAWPPALYASLVKGTAALMKHMRADPAKLLVGHKEYAPHRKNDPDPLNMASGRAAVAAAMTSTPSTPAKPTPTKPTPAKPAAPALVKFPGKATFAIGKRSKYTTMLGEWLIQAGYGRSGDANGYQAGPTFTEYDRKNVALFQRSRAALKGDPDGYPGPQTWQLLQQAAAAKR
ncbi:MAG: N-acetylmuramoyl-L-alanine amidase [Nonomuraea sp.]|nr:N-acetylmuramoyl-L-alanine amidase [Nonomuraea sp.]